MPLTEAILIALGLAMDSFAVALGASAHGSARRWHVGGSMVVSFAAFQGGALVLGWLAGLRISLWLTWLDHWIAFGLLAVVGLRMIHGGLRRDDAGLAISGCSTVLVLAIATSIDALAVGLSMALVDVDARGPGVVVALVTGALTALGVLSGRALGRAFGDRMQIVGGFVLLFIGGQILVSHLGG